MSRFKMPRRHCCWLMKRIRRKKSLEIELHEGEVSWGAYHMSVSMDDEAVDNEFANLAVRVVR